VRNSAAASPDPGAASPLRLSVIALVGGDVDFCHLDRNLRCEVAERANKFHKVVGLSNIVIKEILRKKGLSEPSAAARRAGCRSPGDRHHQAFAAPGRYPTLVGRDFRMAPTHGGCALAAVTDHHHGQPLAATTYTTGC
jgi:hypothetical protein